ncbi:conserved repeat domain-containing protein [Thermus arciformis]|uniref:Conserved repeat domain-containing protein n=1 Tax=Thermus arciformis TaxID=482827 RepID=A0A1G7LRQ9_9DEIN|nr:carboxypeptidase regulatory-like domain-containing protein [Thermus arciformis]SDF52081.1 conserved repeat domain-containing protein [Thermus arciformis]
MKGVRLKAFGVALLGALALLFAGCGQQGGGGTQAPTKGSLTVNVTPADAQVQVTGPGGYSQNFTGGKTLTDLDPGSYTVQASKAGYFDAQATHQVEAGKTTTVVLNLLPVPAASPTEGKVAVLVVNGNGAPIAGATVSDGTNSATTDAQGRADLTYTAAGAYAISVNKSGYLGDAKLASVELGKVVALTFKLQPEPTPAPTTGTLVVHVYGADTGQTLTGASVSSDPSLTFSGSGGLFTATAAPGTYAVTASAAGYLDGSRAAQVEAGKTTVLNLGLQKDTASGPVGAIEIVSVTDQWGQPLPVNREDNPAKDVNLYASQTEEPVCVTVRVTNGGQPVAGARVRVSAISYGEHAALLYKGCETQNVTELDFVMTDANGIAKFSFQGIGDYEGISPGLVKFLISASEEGSGWTARSKEFKVFFYNITHLYLRDGGNDDALLTGDDVVRYSGRRTGADLGTIVNAFNFDSNPVNRHLFRAEVRRKQPTTDLLPITGFGYVRYELVGGDVSKVDLCDISPATCAAAINDTDGSGIYLQPKSSVHPNDLPISVRVKATLYVVVTYGSSEYTFALKDFTFTKTWTGAALAIEKSGPTVIGWSGTDHSPNDVTLVQSGAGVPSGATYTYTITVRNLSTTETANNVVVTDLLPAELGFVSASAGGTYDPILHTVTWDYTTTPALTSIAPGGSVSVTVTVYARHKPGYVWNDKDGDMATDGDENLNEPGYYYSLRPPAYGTTSAYPDPYSFDNRAVARGDNTPEASTAKRIYVVRPFFTLTKTPSSATVFQGDRVRFTLTATNLDRAEAPISDADYQALKAAYPVEYAAALTGYSLKVRDLFGEGLDFVNASPAGALDPEGKTLEWDLGDLALGASTSIIVDLRASEEGTWGNCARLYAWNLNQFLYDPGPPPYPLWNVPPTQLEPTTGTDPRPSPPYTPETANPDTVGNYLEDCATVDVQARPTAYALAISSLGEFNSLTGGTSTDPVAEGSDYYYRFEVRAWEGSSGPQNNVTLQLTRTAGNSTFAGTGVKGVDFEVELDPDGPFGPASYAPVLSADVQVLAWGSTGVQLRYLPSLAPGATLRFSVRANAVNGTNTTVQADASSTEAPGPYTVTENTTIIP